MIQIWIKFDKYLVQGANGTGTCQGDSGSSLQYSPRDGLYIQYGIVSFGASTGCGSGVYTVYCTLYTVHCILYTVNCTLYSINTTLKIVHVYCRNYTENCALCNVCTGSGSTLYTEHHCKPRCALCTLSRTNLYRSMSQKVLAETRHLALILLTISNNYSSYNFPVNSNNIS